MWRLPLAVTSSVSPCRKSVLSALMCRHSLNTEGTEDHSKFWEQIDTGGCMSSTVTRRTFAARVGALLSTLGITGSALVKSASARTSTRQSAAQNSAPQGAGGIRKMNAEG